MQFWILIFPYHLSYNICNLFSKTVKWFEFFKENSVLFITIALSKTDIRKGEGQGVNLKPTDSKKNWEMRSAKAIFGKKEKKWQPNRILIDFQTI